MAGATYPIHKDVKTLEQARREFQKIGKFLSLIDDRLEPHLDNLTAIVDPTVDDDITLGYTPGSMWFNQVLDKFWINEDNTDGAAQWTLLFGGGGLLDFDRVESHVAMLALDDANEITFSE